MRGLKRGGVWNTLQEDVHAQCGRRGPVRREAKKVAAPEGNPHQSAYGVRFLCTPLSPGSEALRALAKPLPQPWIRRRGGLRNASDLPVGPPSAPGCL